MIDKLDIMDRLKGTAQPIKYVMVLLVGYFIGFMVSGEAFNIGNNILRQNREMASGGAGGFYNNEYRWIVCREESSCLHEVAHWKDAELDSISETPEFTQAIDELISNCSYKLLEYCWLVEFPGVGGNSPREDGWGDYSEAYATVYAYSLYYGTPIPRNLEEFYKR